MRELLRDIQRDVGADYALFDEVHHLELTTQEAVDQALLKSENFRKAVAKAIAMAEAQAKAAAEATAMAIAEAQAKAATEAQAKAKTISEAQTKAAAEEVAKEIAKEQAAHAAMRWLKQLQRLRIGFGFPRPEKLRPQRRLLNFAMGKDRDYSHQH